MGVIFVSSSPWYCIDMTEIDILSINIEPFYINISAQPWWRKIELQRYVHIILYIDRLWSDFNELNLVCCLKK